MWDSRQGKPGISKVNQEAYTTADKTAEQHTGKAVASSTSDTTTEGKVEVAVQVSGEHGKIVRGSATTSWKSAETDMLLPPCMSVKDHEVTATESVVHTDQLERVSTLVGPCIVSSDS